MVLDRLPLGCRQPFWVLLELEQQLFGGVGTVRFDSCRPWSA
jgi:hypothetical protein